MVYQDAAIVACISCW